jgi:hypothetical protein
MDNDARPRENRHWENRERRKDRRYPARPGAFASVRNSSHRLGQIANISKGGLSFRYVASKDQKNGHSKMDIFLVDSDFLVRDIPVRTVSDTPVSEKIPFSRIAMRRRGVEFVNMTHILAEGIDWFLRHHTLREGV